MGGDQASCYQKIHWEILPYDEGVGVVRQRVARCGKITTIPITNTMSYPRTKERHDLAKKLKVGDRLVQEDYIVGQGRDLYSFYVVDEIQGLRFRSGDKWYYLSDSDSQHLGHTWRLATPEDEKIERKQLLESLKNKIKGLPIEKLRQLDVTL